MESEPARIKETPKWGRLYELKSNFGTVGGFVRKEIRKRIEDLETPPNDVTAFVAIIERHPDYVAFLEGMKLQRKISVLRDFQPVKIRRKYEPFLDCLKHAIADAANPLAGTTPAKLELADRIAGFIEAQANWKFSEYFDNVDIKFERLNREQERLEYLEGQRNIFQKSPAVAYFDSQLYHMGRDVEQRVRIARAVAMEVKPTPELLSLWQECNSQSAAFIQRIPYLERMLEGLIEVKKLEFIEQELELRKQAQKEKTTLKFSPPFVAAFQQMFENNEFQETLKKIYQKLQEGYQPPFIRGIQSAFEKLQISHRQFGEHLALIGENWEKIKAQTKQSYEREYVSLIHYLIKEGYIIPADYKEFTDWYFLTKHGDKSFSELLNHWPEVSPADFREFHEYKEGLFLQQNEVVVIEQIITKPSQR